LSIEQLMIDASLLEICWDRFWEYVLFVLTYIIKELTRTVLD